ncbi:MAG: lipoyl synthase, partial [Deferribacterota bacterium]|nr:lipoyl synthase [Deferribacterota bacterium]
MSIPSWLKVNINLEEMHWLHKLFNNCGVSTICWNADCPNISECYSKKTATFLLMGDVCTRNCGFCSVKKGKPSNLDYGEAESVKKAVHNLNLNYIVLTTVTRDDLPDGGAAYIYYVINKLKTSGYQLIEILMPDFKSDRNSIDLVIAAEPVVIGHNLETVEALYPVVRPIAGYKRSLNILEYIKKKKPSILTKSSLILGLGESERDVKKTIKDLVS